MRIVTVNHRTGRELIVILFSIQRLFGTSIVLLAFLIFLSVFEQESLLVFFPVVTVISIQVTFVETEFRQQDRITRQLIEIIQQSYRSIIYHEEYIQIVCIVCQGYLTFFSSSEIILAGSKCIPHHSISARRPIIRSRRSNTAVSPLVGIDNLDALSLVRETSVLHTTAIEILIRHFFQRQRNLFLLEIHRSYRFNDSAVSYFIDQFKEGSLFVDFQSYFIRSNCNHSLSFTDSQFSGLFPGTARQDLCFG